MYVGHAGGYLNGSRWTVNSVGRWEEGVGTVTAASPRAVGCCVDQLDVGPWPQLEVGRQYVGRYLVGPDWESTPE